jgi:hypothetical protein
MFSFDTTPSQKAQRSSQAQRIADFWQHLCEVPELNLEAVAKTLSGLDARLSVELCRNGTDFVLRSEERSLRPHVEDLWRAVPDSLRARFRALRPRYDADTAQRAARNWGVDLLKARVRAGFSRGHLLDVVVYVPGGNGGDDERDAAQDTVEALLGEADFDDWIGDVSAVAAPRMGALRVVGSNDDFERAFPLTELPSACDSAIAALYASLPEAPLWKSALDDAWTMFELEPELADDFASQDDLTYTMTCMPEMRKSFLRGDPFASKRFSRHGERFVYLKIDSKGRSSDAELAQRRTLEELIDRTLVDEQVGSVIGSGLGLRYAYIDIALSDPQRGLQVLREVAQANDVSQRSWIQCCDSDYVKQWLPIWDSSPPPPGI